MKTTMTTLEEAADLERALDKRRAKFEKAKADLKTKHDARLADLADLYAADVEAIGKQYSDEAVELYDGLQKKRAEAGRKAAE